MLDRLSQQVQNATVDVRIVRCFRIWQKDSTLNFYLDKMQDKMRKMKRGTLQTRIKFIARHARGKIRRTFARWALNARSATLVQAFVPKPILTPDSMTMLGVLKLQNLNTRGRQNAMGSQPCQKVSQAFIIWKRNAGIPIDYAYDNQIRGQGLLGIDRILTRHIRATELVCLTRIQLYAHEQHRKEKDLTKMLKDNTVFVQKQGVEAIRQNHHNLKWHLFNRVSKSLYQIIDAQIINLNIVYYSL